MTGVIFTSIVISAIIFSCIFWILTFLAKYLYSNKYFMYKFNFYECGFKNMTKKSVQYHINYIMLVLFLLIYDGEFLVLIPLAFNITIINLILILNTSVFIILLLIALIYDMAYNALDWQIYVLFYTYL